MISQAFVGIIRGLPHNPSITEINTRSGPSTQYDVPFKAAVGPALLPVLEVRSDESGSKFQGKLYQWFRLQFPNGQSAWVRDDLLSVQGNGASFGYPSLSKVEFAFALTRQDTPPSPAATPATPTPAVAPAPAAPPPAVAPTPTVTSTPPPAAPAPAAPTPAVAPAVPTVSDTERVRIAAFNITAAFEGGGYATYQNYDSGIVSYGRFQFTLAGSGLFRVLEIYTGGSTSAIASELRSNYLERVRNHDASLRGDVRLKDLLIEAAKDAVMQAAQDQVATEQYWNVVQDLSIKPRNIRLPLSLALIFDMGINFGPRHGFLTRAEQETGLPARGFLPDEASERKLITRLAELRRDSHYRQAERDNLPGLKPRGDFWVNQAYTGNWQLKGDANGELEIKTGRRVRV